MRRALPAFFDSTQEELRAAVPTAPFPTVGHVTLRGFSTATPRYRAASYSPRFWRQRCG